MYMYARMNFAADFLMLQCCVAMSCIRPVDERKCCASLPSENIAQFCWHEKVSVLSLFAVLTGYFPVNLRPKVA